MAQLQTEARAGSSIESVRLRRQASIRGSFESSGIDALLISRDCDIRFLTGFCGHDSLLVLHNEGAVCISDNRYDEQLNPLRESEVAEVVIGIRHRLHETVVEVCREHSIQRLGVQASHMTIAGKAKLEQALKGVKVVATSDLVESRRMRKDSFEISSIERAIDVAQSALAATLPQMSEGMTEREVAALLEYEMKRRGADKSSFNPIVAVGAHGSLPHYEIGDAKLTKGSSLLIDWGCTIGGYNSDLTRTFGVGSLPDEVRKVYNIVLDAQLAAIDAIEPGKTCAEIDAVARDHIRNAGYGDYFGHGLGHGMGLEVHEAPYFNHLQTDVVLEPGIVMTVEPGIYLPGVAGVRIEDDIVVTDTGCRVLSSIGKDLESAILHPRAGGSARTRRVVEAARDQS